MKPSTAALIHGFRCRRAALLESLPYGDPDACVTLLARIRGDVALALRSARGLPVSRWRAAAVSFN